MVMAWSIEQALICPDCGTYYEEWDPTKGGHIHAYWPKPIRCLGCKAKSDSYSAVRENDKSNSATHGIQMTLIKNPQAPSIRSPLNGKPIVTVESIRSRADTRQ